MPGESFSFDCVCPPLPGTTVPPGTTPFVAQLNSLTGIVTLAGSGAIDIISVNNTIFIDISASAGLGSVTSVSLASNNSNLSVVSGSPITTLGTITLGLAGNIGSISGLVMAADEMLYSTGVATFATTSFPAFGRTLIANASAADARTDLGLVIGTNVQAWSADLDSFVTVASFSGINITFSGEVNAAQLITGGDVSATGGAFSDNVTIGDTLTVTNGVTGGSFSGVGTALTALNASNLTSGTTAVARGGTNIASYTTGDLIYASAGTTLAKLADVAAGAFLRSGGVATAPVWSTTLWPNTLTTGDILYASSTTQVARLANVATGNVLLSGGVGVASAFGKVTTSHTTGIAASGVNSDITGLGADVAVSGEIDFNDIVRLLAEVHDSSDSPGTAGEVMVSTGSGVDWTFQLTLDTLTINTNLGLEGTITGAGNTGNQVINKPSGTVRIAAAGTSAVITNSLATTSHRCQATVCSNDTTAKAAAAVVTAGAITVYLNAAATAETEIYWEIHQIT